jgi:hypothetical protein
MGTPDYEQVRSAVLDAVRDEGLAPEVLQRRVTDRVGIVPGLPRLLEGLRRAGLLDEVLDAEGIRLTRGPKAGLYRE